MVLAAPAGQGVGEVGRVRPGRVVAQLIAATLIVIAVVGVGGAVVGRRLAEQQSVHDVAELTDVLAVSVLQPNLSDAMLTTAGATDGGLDSLIRSSVLSDSLIRVKLWTPEGVIVYSDEPRLTGDQFALDSEARKSLTTPEVVASVSDLSRPENQFERGDGRLLEVYRPVWTPGGHPMLFETYFRYDAVEQRSAGLTRGFVGVMLTSLAALLLLLAPVVWRLLRRAGRDQQVREAIAERALAASESERRRVAASLHDGPVQQLVASALTVSARAERAAADGDADRAADLRAAARELRGSISGLRALLVEIYPANLEAAGLAAALRDVAGTLSPRDCRIVIDIDEDVAQRVSPHVAETVFRVAQEAMRNAVRHAGASVVTVRVRDDGDRVRLDVDDDGIGFDVATTMSRADDERSGHLGLDLIADAAARAGARLRISSAPGSGARCQLEVPK